MKKIMLFGVCAFVLATVSSAALAARDPVKFTVDETQKANVEAQIKRYEQQARAITDKAEAEIKQAQSKFETVKAKSEKTISDANTQIKKLRADAEQAQAEFEKVKAESNATIEAANAKIKKANEDLEANIKALASSVENSVEDQKADLVKADKSAGKKKK